MRIDESCGRNMKMVWWKIEELRHRKTQVLMGSLKQKYGLKKRGLVDRVGLIQKCCSEKMEEKNIKTPR